ncbi:conserved hypothetical protein [Dinoroseobacter shibae DFL 12 = DSM 16493]|jgi:hypothetical protein|uniref:Uncharacterized protein n=1 Tax=Dinoroseobacter shibae (strain DSM 16493 / NCIMB 14021 / DFL 12) TaxID=398580 RepID=A8LPT4_DINSH|nr:MULTISPECIES: hypothetical protein [Dinoroseobacter]ABV93788.1 conserved hypothetical protein [Dinoroseobacter shibae DFL 12 = DSM 16493]MDD9719042.1 hypothetical protein [Dinoroseobacter sp. PD6]URF45240.1 hypothetical protein M8008_10610 [Dinoroseobacter shibae]URF49545.1 hypothetical protein M8007_10610 [Dinoroseobacter shibae]
MTVQATHRGAATVGYVQDLPPLERDAVLYLRLWCDGPDAQARVWTAFAASLGPEAGRPALKALENLCMLCLRHGRRPMARHGVACKCLGADEACFANFVGYASEGSTEDALLLATTLVRPDMGYQVVGLAQEFGLALRRMVLRSQDPPRRVPLSVTLH